MKKLIEWKARRSGPSITITGTTEEGTTVRVAVDEIMSSVGLAVATDKQGNKYQLS